MIFSVLTALPDCTFKRQKNNAHLTLFTPVFVCRSKHCVCVLPPEWHEIQMSFGKNERGKGSEYASSAHVGKSWMKRYREAFRSSRSGRLERSNLKDAGEKADTLDLLPHPACGARLQCNYPKAPSWGSGGKSSWLRHDGKSQGSESRKKHTLCSQPNHLQSLDKCNGGKEGQQLALQLNG